MHGGAQAGLLMHLFARPPDGPRAEVRPGAHLGDHRARGRPADLHDRRRDGAAADRGVRAQGATGTPYDGSSLFAISSSAAIFSRAVKKRWMAAFPNAIFTDSVGRLGDRLPGHRAAGQGQRSAPTDRSSALGPEQRRDRRRQPDPRPGHRRRQGRPARSRRQRARSATTRTRRSRRRPSSRSTASATRCPATTPGSRPGNQVTLLGRGSNCVNTGGEKVYPEEVEMAIKAHPAVYDCLVVGIPDEKYGQAVAAVVAAPRGRDPRARGAAHVPARAACPATSCRAR